MPESAPIRILSVDDHPILREGIAAILNSQSDMLVINQAASGSEAIKAYRALQPDVTLMDLRLPDFNGIDVLMAIRTEFPEARIIMLTTFGGDVEVQRAVHAGAYGYLLKSMPPKEMLDSIRRVHTGRKCFSPQIAAGLVEHMGSEILSKREMDVLRHVAEGNRNRDIGQRLFISEETVKVHVKHIMGKLGASDRTQAVAIAARRGFICL